MIVIVLLAAYFLPSIVGWNKTNFGAIFALNLLLGWTVVGWIVSFIWALTKDSNVVAVQTPASTLCASCGRYSPGSASFCASCGAQLT